MLDDRRAESFVLSFRDGIALLEQPDGGTVLRSSDAEITLGRPSPGFRTALRVLSSDGATEEQLLDLVSDAGGGEGDASKVWHYLRYFTQHGILWHALTWNESRIVPAARFATAWHQIPSE